MYLSSISFDFPSCIYIYVRNNKLIKVDDIPVDFLYNLRDLLSFYLHLLFQKSLSEGESPFIFKLRSITPILKSGNPTNVSNYRPISALCHISILYVTFMHNNIKPAVKHNMHMNSTDSDQQDQSPFVIYSYPLIITKLFLIVVK